MTDHRNPHRHLSSRGYATPLPAPLELIPLAEMVARIEAVRRHVELPTTRRCCGPCDETKPLAEFPKNAREALGRSYRCLECEAARMRAVRAERKRRQFRAILGRAS